MRTSTTHADTVATLVMCNALKTRNHHTTRRGQPTRLVLLSSEETLPPTHDRRVDFSVRLMKAHSAVSRTFVGRTTADGLLLPEPAMVVPDDIRIAVVECHVDANLTSRVAGKKRAVENRLRSGQIINIWLS